VNDIRLDGRLALITGASSGFGAHFARVFVAAGARVALGARRKNLVDALAEELGPAALPLELNVEDESSIIKAFDAADEHFGAAVDTVIANAGRASGARATDIEGSEARSTIDVNLTGAFFTAREGARRMIKAGSRETRRGRIVLIGSITARQTRSLDSLYASSKAAIAHLGRNLAREWSRQGINVNVVQPGHVDTGFHGTWLETEPGKAFVNAFDRKRLVPIEAVDPIVKYLASDDSEFMTGSIIDMDDGQSL
jgi:NAD(P)-dependent dehydrogenase (short-subunit alcohol dehydrogenase family)